MIAPTAPAPSLAAQAAASIVQTYASARQGLAQSCAFMAQAFWHSQTVTKPGQPVSADNPLIVTPATAIAAELTPGSVREICVADLLARLLLGYEQSAQVDAVSRAATHMALIVQYSPIPQGNSITFKDANGATVDISAELSALVAKVCSIETATVA